MSIILVQFETSNFKTSAQHETMTYDALEKLWSKLTANTESTRRLATEFVKAQIDLSVSFAKAFIAHKSERWLEQAHIDFASCLQALKNALKFLPQASLSPPEEKEIKAKIQLMYS